MSVVGEGSAETKALLARVKGILLKPNEEWDVIDVEPATTQGLFTRYACILAALPAVCGFIGGQVFGHGALGVVYRPPLIGGIVSAILTYVLSLVMVFVLGLIIDALAPSFDGQKNPVQALKVSVYSYTASWVVGIFGLIPALAPLAILGGLYGIYLLYLGLPKLMKAPEQKAFGYTAVAVVVAIVLSLVVGAVMGSISAMAMFAGGGLAGGTVSTATGTTTGSLGVPGVGSVDLGKLEAASKQLQAGSAKEIKPVPGAQLQTMLPAGLGGLARGDISNQSGGVAGLSGSSAEARYDGTDRHITLGITDLGGAAGFAAMGGALNINSSKQTANGYEKVGQVDGRMTTEEWNGPDKSGKYGVMVANRFMVQAEGEGVAMDDLKGAVRTVNFGALEALAKS